MPHNRTSGASLRKKTGHSGAFNFVLSLTYIVKALRYEKYRGMVRSVQRRIALRVFKTLSMEAAVYYLGCTAYS